MGRVANHTGVQELYSGPEGRLWELVAGEMLHCGGYGNTVTLAAKVGVEPGQGVLDLCSGFGTSLRFLAKRYGIHGKGLEASTHMVEEANRRTRAEGLEGAIEYLQGNAMEVPFPDDTFDVVWGEDAWCYVDDKERLVEEAVRVLKPGGVMGFSDWMTGPADMTVEQAARIHGFLSFPYTESLQGYVALLEARGMTIRHADDLCGQFVDSMELYLQMITRQLTYDALEILGDDTARLDEICDEWRFMIEMGRAGRFGQGRVVAVKE